MTHILTDPGFYEIEAEDYHADPAPEPSLSSSVGQLVLDKCPLAAMYAHPRLSGHADAEQSTRMDRGTAAHTILLGKGRTMRLIDAPDYKGKVAQLQRNAYRDAGFVPILVEHHNTAQAMVRAARKWLDGAGFAYAFGDECGTSELCALWRDPAGCWGRTLIDWYGAKVVTGVECWDYKTRYQGASANPAHLAYHAADNGWWFQAAFQERGIVTLKPELAGKIRFRFLVQEDQAPHLCSIIEPGPGAMTIAHKQVAAAMHIWAQALATKQWPGYPTAPQPLAIPASMEQAWLNREIAEFEASNSAGRAAFDQIRDFVNETNRCDAAADGAPAESATLTPPPAAAAPSTPAPQGRPYRQRPRKPKAEPLALPPGQTIVDAG